MKTTGAACEKVAAAKTATGRRFYMSGSQPRHWLNSIDWQAIEVNTLMTWYYQSDYKASHLFAVLFLCDGVGLSPCSCPHPIDVLPCLATGAALYLWWPPFPLRCCYPLPQGTALCLWWPPSSLRCCHPLPWCCSLPSPGSGAAIPCSRCCHPFPW